MLRCRVLRVVSLRRGNEQVKVPPLELLICQARIARNLRMLSFLLPFLRSTTTRRSFRHFVPGETTLRLVQTLQIRQGRNVAMSSSSFL